MAKQENTCKSRHCNVLAGLAIPYQESEEGWKEEREGRRERGRVEKKEEEKKKKRINKHSDQKVMSVE